MDIERHTQSQLSLEVGGEEPLVSTFKISGPLTTKAELPKGADVRVMVMGVDGAIIADGLGWIQQVSFKEHRPEKSPWFTERAHSIRVE